MPQIFGRKSPDLVSDAINTTAPAEPESPAPHPPKGYTPSKKELGKQTPKRISPQRRHAMGPPPANRREALKQMRARQRAERAEAQAGMRAGDERFLLARDRGPERSLVRNIVDSRRTIGSWFFIGAVVVLFGAQPTMPKAVQLASNIFWVVLAVAVVIDSVLICLKIKTLVTSRFPQTSQRMRSLYLYGVMRGLTFRRMRVPKPKVEVGATL